MISCAFWVACTFCVGLVGGILSGWGLCRGLCVAQQVQDQGVSLTRITLDPGRFPWSGAATKLLSPDLIESE